MDNTTKILQLIFYIIWIPLGLLLFGVIVSLVITNATGRFNQMTNQPSGQFQQGGINQQQFPGNQQQPSGQSPESRQPARQPNNLPTQPTGTPR